jgi:hypothetical protein
LATDEDALDALEATVILRVHIKRLIVQIDGLDRGFQLVVQDIGHGDQVASLVLARLGLGELVQHLHRAHPLLCKRVNLHQLVQRLGVIGTQRQGLLEGLLGSLLVVQFLTLQASDAAQNLEALIGRPGTREQHTMLLHKGCSVVRSPPFYLGVGFGQRLAQVG